MSEARKYFLALPSVETWQAVNDRTKAAANVHRAATM